MQMKFVTKELTRQNLERMLSAMPREVNVEEWGYKIVGSRFMDKDPEYLKDELAERLNARFTGMPEDQLLSESWMFAAQQEGLKSAPVQQASYLAGLRGKLTLVEASCYLRLVLRDGVNPNEVAEYMKEFGFFPKLEETYM